MSDVATLELKPQSVEQLLEAAKTVRETADALFHARGKAEDATEVLVEAIGETVGGLPYESLLSAGAMQLQLYLRYDGDGSSFDFDNMHCKALDLLELLEHAIEKKRAIEAPLDGAA